MQMLYFAVRQLFFIFEKQGNFMVGSFPPGMPVAVW
jgi:hypothetical protein